MGIFEVLERCQYEQLLLCSDPSTRLRAIIAVHDTT